ncbi:leucine-rich repeat and calponin homology domain-containing protein 1 isoform X1 [Tachysurus ichikawai]
MEVSGAAAPRVLSASRGVERALEEAAGSGTLNLSSRKLKEFTSAAAHYDLSDTVHAGAEDNRDNRNTRNRVENLHPRGSPAFRVRKAEVHFLSCVSSQRL